MRIVFAGHSSGLLGAERSMLEITQGAVAAGHEVIALLPDDGPLTDRLRAVGARVEILPSPSWLGPRHWIPPLGLWRLNQVRKAEVDMADLVRRIQPDVVVSNSAAVVAPSSVAGGLGIPHVWIIRESLRDNAELRSILPKRWIARRIFQRSAAVCVVSSYVSDQLADLTGAHQVTELVHPNPAIGGVDFVGAPSNRRPVLVLPGFQSPEKGQHVAVLAAWRARRSGADFELRLVGRGRRLFGLGLRLMVRVLSAQGYVTLVPWLDSIDPELRRADFLVTSSKNEAFGRSVIEAFARGVPVIGLDRGATSSLLAEGGGLLASPGTSRGLAQIFGLAASMGPEERGALRAAAQARGIDFGSQAGQFEMLRGVLERCVR